MKQIRISKFEVRNGSAGIFSAMLAITFLVASVASDAQQPGKVYRIGYLGNGAPPAPANTTPQQCPITGSRNWQAFVAGLREYGYLPGQNLRIECRWTGGEAERARALAVELVSLKPDLIVVASGVLTRAVKQATSTIPIVMVNVTDPVGLGLVASLAHPGGNITGPTDTVGVEFRGKQLQLLKEAAPTVSRVAVLRYSGAGRSLSVWREEEAAARDLGLTLQLYGVQAPEELQGAFAAMTTARAEALFVEDWTFLEIHGQRIIDLAAQSRMPAVYSWTHLVRAGGLLAYGVDYPAIWRRVGFYVDKILKGANPGDLPVEQPTKFELIINLKTANALGLAIPQSLLMRADEVIE
jgi:putative ABC transport system substrate-binding protein